MNTKIGIPLRLGHLPLVMDIFRRSGMRKIIDDAIGQDSRSDVSTSECIAVILCGVYTGAHSMWRLRDRLEAYDMKTIMQDATFDLNRYPEERLTKALDDIYKYNIDKLMTSIAVPLIYTYSIDMSFVNFDTTSLSMFGAYENDDPWSGLNGMPAPPKVTFGNSKAHRPDLKQIMYGMLVSSDGGIPLLGKALDGNASDAQAAAEFFHKVRELVIDPREVCCVSDCKGWSANVLKVIADSEMRMLSRLPKNHKLHKEIMEQPWNPTGKLELVPKAGKKNDPDIYTYQGFDVTEHLTANIINKDGSITKQALDIPARAIRIHSTALVRTKTSTRSRLHEKEKKDAIKKIRDWQDEVFKCQTDASRAALRRVEQSDWATLDLHAEAYHVDGPVTKGRGRPRNNPEPELICTNHWRVRYHVTPVSEQTTKERIFEQATFILIRTKNEGWQFSDESMIIKYKGQYHVEHGFSWFKSAAEINPVFLHTPHRISSLCFTYCLGLMIWNIIQRNVRKYLNDNNAGLPYHRNKPSKNITTRFLFELFPKVQTIPVENMGVKDKLLVGFDDWQQLATKALGTSFGAFNPIL
jgi:transposase